MLTRAVGGTGSAWPSATRSAPPERVKDRGRYGGG